MEDYKCKLLVALNESFRPEFLNRIDELIVFNPLRPEAMRQIVEIQLAAIEKRLRDRRITIQIDEKAKEYLAKEGFDAEFGARPVKRLIQKVILDQLANRIIKGELKDGGKVKISSRANSLVFSS